MPILWPFKKYDLEDFPDVYVPLAQAQRHRSVVAENERRASLRTLVDAENGAATTKENDSNSKKSTEKGMPGSPDTPHKEALTLESLRAEIDADVSVSGHDSAYDRKSKVINKAIQDIGMGRYQWELFALCGFGWFADNMWLQGVALTLPSLSQEFGVSENNVRYTTLALFVGLCCGAVFWGVTADIIGRRPAFNLTLFITSVFGIAVGGASSWLQVCALYAAMGCGVGGNLPVDGALFLEFLPFASGNLLTLLSVWWPFGQLYGSLIAWGYLTTYNCQPLEACNGSNAGNCCTKDLNMGWRYLNYTLGCSTFLMFFCRFFLFHLFESPKFLLSRGKQREAVSVVRAIAYHNKTKTWLSEEILDEIGGVAEGAEEAKLKVTDIIKRSLSRFSGDRIAPIFAYKKLAINTVLLWFIWAAIGMAYPLFNAFILQYLESADPNAPPTPQSILYRNYAIESIVGCPGSILACFTVNIKYVGRRGTMAISAMLTGVFLFLFTISANSDFQLGFSCMVAFFQNIAYGVLYAYSPETFPAPNRGTGSGISSFLNRIAGFCAPLVAINAGKLNPKVPIYISGGLMLAAFAAMVGLPIETMGKQTV